MDITECGHTESIQTRSNEPSTILDKNCDLKVA